MDTGLRAYLINVLIQAITASGSTSTTDGSINYAWQKVHNYLVLLYYI